jgi:FkbM family methyltransferase
VSIVRESLSNENTVLSDKVVVVNAGVGSFRSISVPLNTCDGSFRANAKDYTSPLAAVAVVPLSTFFYPGVGKNIFIKIDTEGAEVNILREIARLHRRFTLLQWIVVVEVVPGFWESRGSSVAEGLAVLRQMSTIFHTMLLTDGTPFTFSKQAVQVPGIHGEVYEAFDMQQLVQSRLDTNSGCNIVFQSK